MNPFSMWCSGWCAALAYAAALYGRFAIAAACLAGGVAIIALAFAERRRQKGGSR